MPKAKKIEVGGAAYRKKVQKARDKVFSAASSNDLAELADAPYLKYRYIKALRLLLDKVTDLRSFDEE